jgi:signal peptidase II
MANNAPGRWVFLIVPFLIIAGLVFYLVVHRPPLLTRLSLALVLSGAVGNIYDRVAYGHVVDFIDVRLYGSYHWPAFNVADSAITVGIILWLCAQLLTKEKVDERKEAIRD